MHLSLSFDARLCISLNCESDSVTYWSYAYPILIAAMQFGKSCIPHLISRFASVYGRQIVVVGTVGILTTVISSDLRVRKAWSFDERVITRTTRKIISSYWIIDNVCKKSESVKERKYLCHTFFFNNLVTACIIAEKKY